MTAQRLDVDYVRYRVHLAGKTLCAIPDRGPSLHMRVQSLEVQNAVDEAAAEGRMVARWAATAKDIALMDEVMPAWFQLIPDLTMRRAVSLRSLVSPVTDREIYSWTRLARTLHSDNVRVQKMWARGIDLILDGLRRKPKAMAATLQTKAVSK